MMEVILFEVKEKERVKATPSWLGGKEELFGIDAPQTEVNAPWPEKEELFGKEFPAE